MFSEIGLNFNGTPDNVRLVGSNGSGAIVGLWNPFLTGEPSIFQSFLFDQGAFTKIELILPSSVAPCRDHETVATSISNNGDIGGHFQYGNLASPCPENLQVEGTFLWNSGTFYTNDVQGFPLVPTPEPGTLLLYGTGIVILGIRAAWRRRRGAL